MGDRDEESVRAGMHELVRKELVRVARTSSVKDQSEYAFWHALVRDVAYSQIPRSARVLKHVAAAEWIEQMAGDRLTDHAELLAYHYGEAFRSARDDARADPATVESLRRNAFLSLVKAAEDARSKMATTKATRLAEQAQAVAATPEERATTMESLGLTAHLDYRGDEAWRWLSDAAARASVLNRCK